MGFAKSPGAKALSCANFITGLKPGASTDFAWRTAVSGLLIGNKYFYLDDVMRSADAGL
jgi:hypothetical protein